MTWSISREFLFVATVLSIALEPLIGQEADRWKSTSYYEASIQKMELRAEGGFATVRGLGSVSLRGYGIGLGAGLNLANNWSVLGRFRYSGVPFADLTITPPTVPTIDPSKPQIPTAPEVPSFPITLIDASFDLRYRFNSEPRDMTAYLFVGPALVRTIRSESILDNRGFSDTLATFDASAFGYSAGLGGEIPIGKGAFRLFAEARTNIGVIPLNGPLQAYHLSLMLGAMIRL